MPSTFGNIAFLLVVVVVGSLAAVDRLRSVAAHSPAGQSAPANASVASRAPSAAPAAPSFSSDRIETLALRNNHFWAEASINGAMIDALVDTGASIVVLSERDAARIGVLPQPGDRKTTFQTANGRVEGHLKTLREVRVGNIVVRDVEAAVLPREALNKTLLGMSFLSRLRGYEVRGDKLLLRD